MALQSTTGFWPVTLALLGNTFVTIIKFAAAFVSGSAVLFSEAIHSVADTFNQALLLIGLQRSQKAPDDSFEYGYGNERFFWALISACGVFFIGAGITAYKGITTLLHPEPIEFSPLIIIVLATALVVEFYTFRRAAVELKKISPRGSWRTRIERADPSTLAVYLEDAVAVFGVLVAAASIGISYVSGTSTADAVGSIVIAMLLAGVAVVLISKNYSYLIGKAMPEEMQDRVVRLVASDPVIERVIDFKSSVVGFGRYRIKFELDLRGEALLKEARSSQNADAEYELIKNDPLEFEKLLASYSERIPRLIGKKIDELENRIKILCPEIKHIDIEIN